MTIHAHSRSEDSRADLALFEALCDQLGALTDQENAIFLAHDGGRCTHLREKIALLERFTYHAHDLLDTLNHAQPENIAVQGHVLEKVQLLQEKLRVNAQLHMEAISALCEQDNKAHIDNTDKTDNKDGQAWH